jgi:pSer/pThr/pTyr-binding forkhead associated (FHA) protein
MGGAKLGAHAPRILKHKDLARVGRVWLEFRFDGGIPPAQTSLATRELALSLVARALDAQGELGGPLLRVVEGPDTGKTLELGEGSRAYVLGRASDADLVLEDDDASRRHVQVVRRADQLLVRDLGSKNGAELGKEGLGDRDRAWKPGEELRVGRNTVVYQHAAIAALAELEGAADEMIRPDEPLSPPDLDDPGAGAGPRTSHDPPTRRRGKAHRRAVCPVEGAPPSSDGQEPISSWCCSQWACSR